jgi:serpin B
MFYIQTDIHFLPKTRYGLTDIENELTNSTIHTILNNTNYLQVRLTIPKFKLETNYSLIEPLKKLGLDKAFKPEADFSGITTEEPLMINKVNHKAYIKIDEEKTEAAAATIIAMMTGSAGGSMPKPKIFKADHPFTFMIIDNKTKGIIFIGRYARPE